MISIADDGTAELQGAKKVTFTLIDGELSKNITLDFGDGGAITVKI